MQLPAWLDTLQTHVPEDAPAGARHRIETTVGRGADAHHIAAEALVDCHGQRRERFWCDGARLQRHELLRLTCPETECPQAAALRGQWQDFLRRQRGGAGPVPRTQAPAPAPLMQERALQFGGQACIARPAVFRCFTPCPNGAHPPLWIVKRGFDLFEDGVCIGGGLAADGDGQPRRPRIPTLQAAQAWLAARGLESAAVVAALAERR